MGLTRAVGLGLFTGVRSMAGLAALIDHASQQPITHDDGIPYDLRTRDAAALLRAMQLGEFVLDKLPFMPARTAMLPLLGRVAIGGLVGALSSRDDRANGAIAGAGMAVVGTLIGLQFRTRLQHQTGLPDPLVALVEDAIAVLGARMVIEETDKQPG